MSAGSNSHRDSDNANHTAAGTATFNDLTGCQSRDVEGDFKGLFTPENSQQSDSDCDGCPSTPTGVGDAGGTAIVDNAIQSTGSQPHHVGDWCKGLFPPGSFQRSSADADYEGRPATPMNIENAADTAATLDDTIHSSPHDVDDWCKGLFTPESSQQSDPDTDYENRSATPTNVEHATGADNERSFGPTETDDGEFWGLFSPESSQQSIPEVNFEDRPAQNVNNKVGSQSLEDNEDTQGGFTFGSQESDRDCCGFQENGEWEAALTMLNRADPPLRPVTLTAMAQWHQSSQGEDLDPAEYQSSQSREGNSFEEEEVMVIDEAVA